MAAGGKKGGRGCFGNLAFWILIGVVVTFLGTTLWNNRDKFGQLVSIGPTSTNTAVAGNKPATGSQSNAPSNAPSNTSYNVVVGPQPSSGAVGGQPGAVVQTDSGNVEVAAFLTPIYVVENGDDLNSIARKLGTTADALRKANPGVDFSKLQAGEIINVPATGGGENTPGLPGTGEFAGDGY